MQKVGISWDSFYRFFLKKEISELLIFSLQGSQQIKRERKT